MVTTDGAVPPTKSRQALRWSDRILGPRVPTAELRRHHRRFVLPAWLFGAAAVLLIASVFLPYWRLDLQAPQYPKGLRVRAYVNRMVGDVEEITVLNQNIGLPPLTAAATLERSVSMIAALVLAGLLLAGWRVRSRWVVVLAAPALLFPFAFLADLQFWLWKYGHSLNPAAPLSHAVGAFTQPVLGPAKVAQFHTLALPDIGLVLALCTSALTLAGLWAHRRAFKPLYDAMAATHS